MRRIELKPVSRSDADALIRADIENRPYHVPWSMPSPTRRALRIGLAALSPARMLPWWRAALLADMLPRLP